MTPGSIPQQPLIEADSGPSFALTGLHDGREWRCETQRVNYPPGPGKVLAKARFEGDCEATGKGTVQGKNTGSKKKEVKEHGEPGRVRFEFDAGTGVLRVVQEGLCGR